MNIQYNKKSGRLKVISTPEEHTNVQFDEVSGEIEINSQQYSTKKTTLHKFITFIKEWNGLLLPAIGYIIEKCKAVIPIIPKGIVEYVFPLTIGLSAFIVWRRINAGTKKLERILEKVEVLESESSKQLAHNDISK